MEKIKSGSKKRTVLISIIVVVILLLATPLVALYISAERSRVVYTDVSEYDAYRADESVPHFYNQGMAEIWPEEVRDEQVNAFRMEYYNPFDANYTGFMSVAYRADEYEAETKRLSLVDSTEYIGVYGATSFTNGTVLAINASDAGFVYALGDNDHTIHYVEIVFPGYSSDIDYEKIVPGEYLPAGFNAKKDNPKSKEMIERFSRT